MFMSACFSVGASTGWYLGGGLGSVVGSLLCGGLAFFLARSAYRYLDRREERRLKSLTAAELRTELLRGYVYGPLGELEQRNGDPRRELEAAQEQLCQQLRGCDTSHDERMVLSSHLLRIEIALRCMTHGRLSTIEPTSEVQLGGLSLSAGELSLCHSTEQEQNR